MKDTDTLEYRESQLKRLETSPRTYTIRLTDDEGNTTNYLNITWEEFLQIHRILTKG